MNIKDLAVPEIYEESADFRFFLNWFEKCLTKVEYDTTNLADIYDPLRCPQQLLWMLADTMGYKYDDRLPAAFCRLVLLNFMNMIRRKGSKLGMLIAAEINLAQFNIEDYGKENEILYNRLDDTSIPVNSANVIPHTKEGYIELVYFSTRTPTDACTEYVRPLGMYLFQSAGLVINARTKVIVDGRLTDRREIGESLGPTWVAHYSREDYARTQIMRDEEKQKVNTDHKRRKVWNRNSVYEGEPEDWPNPGYRALYSLQMSNNDHIIKSLLNPIFDQGYGPQSVDVRYPDDYIENPLQEDIDKPWNLRYNRELDESMTPMGERTLGDGVYLSDPKLKSSGKRNTSAKESNIQVVGGVLQSGSEPILTAGENRTGETPTIYNLDDYRTKDVLTGRPILWGRMKKVGDISDELPAVYQIKVRVYDKNTGKNLPDSTVKVREGLNTTDGPYARMNPVNAVTDANGLVQVKIFNNEITFEGKHKGYLPGYADITIPEDQDKDKVITINIPLESVPGGHGKVRDIRTRLAIPGAKITATQDKLSFKVTIYKFFDGVLDTSLTETIRIPHGEGEDVSIYYNTFLPHDDKKYRYNKYSCSSNLRVNVKTSEDKLTAIIGYGDGTLQIYYTEAPKITYTIYTYVNNSQQSNRITKQIYMYDTVESEYEDKVTINNKDSFFDKYVVENATNTEEDGNKLKITAGTGSLNLKLYYVQEFTYTLKLMIDGDSNPVLTDTQTIRFGKSFTEDKLWKKSANGSFIYKKENYYISSANFTGPSITWSDDKSSFTIQSMTATNGTATITYKKLYVPNASKIKTIKQLMTDPEILKYVPDNKKSSFFTVKDGSSRISNFATFDEAYNKFKQLNTSDPTGFKYIGINFSYVSGYGNSYNAVKFNSAKYDNKSSSYGIIFIASKFTDGGRTYNITYLIASNAWILAGRLPIDMNNASSSVLSNTEILLNKPFQKITVDTSNVGYATLLITYDKLVDDTGKELINK